MIIAGIDYSLNCPSICIYDTLLGPLCHNTSIYYINQSNVTIKETSRRHLEASNWINVNISMHYEFKDCIGRFQALADWSSSIIVLHNVDLVILEDYAMGAKGLIFNIAEATGILKQHLYLLNKKFITVSPSKSKKSFTGKGNSNKEAMIHEYNSKYNVDIAELLGFKKEFTSSPISDIVDSHALIHTYLKENS